MFSIIIHHWFESCLGSKYYDCNKIPLGFFLLPTEPCQIDFVCWYLTICSKGMIFIRYTLPETNIAPETVGSDEFSFWEGRCYA